MSTNDPARALTLADQELVFLEPQTLGSVPPGEAFVRTSGGGLTPDMVAAENGIVYIKLTGGMAWSNFFSRFNSTRNDDPNTMVRIIRRSDWSE